MCRPCRPRRIRWSELAPMCSTSKSAKGSGRASESWSASLSAAPSARTSEVSSAMPMEQTSVWMRAPTTARPSAKTMVLVLGSMWAKLSVPGLAGIRVHWKGCWWASLSAWQSALQSEPKSACRSARAKERAWVRVLAASTAQLSASQSASSWVSLSEIPMAMVLGSMLAAP